MSDVIVRRGRRSLGGLKGSSTYLTGFIGKRGGSSTTKCVSEELGEELGDWAGLGRGIQECWCSDTGSVLGMSMGSDE